MEYPDASCQGQSSACAFDPQNNLGQYKGTPCPNPKTFTRQDPNGVSLLAMGEQLYEEILAQNGVIMKEMWEASEIIDSWMGIPGGCVAIFQDGLPSAVGATN